MKEEMSRSKIEKIEFLENLEARLERAKEIQIVAGVLSSHGYLPYLVGGCLRDLMMGREPDDWDITTDAKPEEILKIFPDSFYTNEFGTVGVKTDSEDPRLKIIEITTFRKDGEYADHRHPKQVTFAKTIEEDLERRDFTVNAMAYLIHPDKRHVKGVIDLFDGQVDLEKGIIRAVGDADRRFTEDAVRPLRAVRFFAKLGFKIEAGTVEAIKRHAGLLDEISKERIKDEFEKIVMLDKAAEGILKLEELGLLKHVMPELREGIGCGQNKHHIFTVFEHNTKALEYSARQGYSLEVRLASLLHDVGKPRTKRGEGSDCTFYGHQVVGAKMTRRILTDLTFSKKVVDKVNLLVYEHMFMYDPDVVTPAGVRRLLKRVGVENIDDLLKVREADRIGSGVPKAVTYSLRHLKAMIDKEKTAPISPKLLKMNGDIMISELKMVPGPRMGYMIAILLEEVLEKPELNDKDILLKRTRELDALTDSELKKLSEKAKVSAEEAQDRIDEGIKAKHFVK